jgi:hypothetical protein
VDRAFHNFLLGLEEARSVEGSRIASEIDPGRYLGSETGVPANFRQIVHSRTGVKGFRTD